MDNFDLEILRLLQINSRASTEVIGEQIGLSASSCQRRIKKLKQAGLIEREVAILNPEKVANAITVIVDIILEQGGEKQLDKVIDDFANESQVQQLFYVAGDSDFVVVIVAKNMSEFDSLTRRLFMANKNIKKFVSKVVIKKHKSSLSIPLEKLSG